MICNHTRTRKTEARGFSGPVSRDEHRAAHGGITYTEICLSCRCARQVNQNQGFFERSDWSLRDGLLMLAEAARIRAQNKNREQIGWGGFTVGPIFEPIDYREAERLEAEAAKAEY